MSTRTQAEAVRRRRSFRRRVSATVRDTWVLVREFRDGVLLFTVFLISGALTFQLLWNASQLERMRFIESLFHMLAMTFFQPTLEFPRQWYLDMYFFTMPLLGIIALARGVADFVVLLFNRRARQAQWEEAVASTYKNHIIVAGLGHLGIRVVRELVALDEEVVVIEEKADTPRTDEVRAYDIPIIIGDARSLEVLRRAGLEQASALIICTNNDLVNLQIASRVREISKNIRLVMRMFDDEFARSLADRFDISAVMSASMMAAPAFAGAATRAEIIQTFKVADRILNMGRIEVHPGARLDGCRVSEVEAQLDLSIVLLQSKGAVDVHPNPEAQLQAGDVIAVVGTLPRIRELAHQWNRPKT